MRAPGSDDDIVAPLDRDDAVPEGFAAISELLSEPAPDSARHVSVRTPVHVVEAEHALIAAVLLNPEHTLERAELEGLSEADFFDWRYRSMWGAAVVIHGRGSTVSPVTILDYLHRQNRLEAIGGGEAIAQVQASTPVGAVPLAATHARMVRERSQLRALAKLTTEAAERCYLGDPPDVVADELSTQLAGVTAGRGSDSIADLSAVVREAYAGLPCHGVPSKGMRTGWDDLDEMVMPEPGDLVIVAGRPSMGKTQLVLDMARFHAVSRNSRVLLFSMEMSAAQLGRRLLAGQAGLDVRRHSLQKDEHARLAEAAAIIAESPIEIDDTPALTVNEVRSRARRAHRRDRSRPLALVAIDYMQLMAGTGKVKDQTREGDVSLASRGLKALARELGCPVIALSQLNRGVESRADKRPVMSDLRESGAIEQDADSILMLYREDYYKRHTDPTGVAEVIIAKQRNGPTGVVKLCFEDDAGPRFSSLRKEVYAYGQ